MNDDKLLASLERVVNSKADLDEAFKNGVPLTTSQLLAICGSQTEVNTKREHLAAKGLTPSEIDDRLAKEVNAALEKVKSGEFVPAARCYGNRDTIKGD